MNEKVNGKHGVVFLVPRGLARVAGGSAPSWTTNIFFQNLTRVCFENININGSHHRHLRGKKNVVLLPLYQNNIKWC